MRSTNHAVKSYIFFDKRISHLFLFSHSLQLYNTLTYTGWQHKKFTGLIKHRRKNVSTEQRNRKKTTKSNPHLDWFQKIMMSKKHHRSDVIDAADGVGSGIDNEHVDSHIRKNVHHIPQHIPWHFPHYYNDENEDDDEDDNNDDDDVLNVNHADDGFTDRRPEIEANIKSAMPSTSTPTAHRNDIGSSSGGDGSGSSGIVNHGQTLARIDGGGIVLVTAMTDRSPDCNSNIVDIVRQLQKQPSDAFNDGVDIVTNVKKNGIVENHNDDDVEDDDNMNESIANAERKTSDGRAVTANPVIIIDDNMVASPNHILPIDQPTTYVTSKPSAKSASPVVSTSSSMWSSAASVTTTSISDVVPIERGYYEKTIYNKNGVFIENIRKIGNLENENIDDNKNAVAAAVDDYEGEDAQHKVILNAEHQIGNGSGRNVGGNADTMEDEEDDIDDDSSSSDVDDAAAATAAAEARERQKIALMSVPLSEHYVITSSGRIEKTADALASDDVIAQFRGVGGEQQQQQCADSECVAAAPPPSSAPPTADAEAGAFSATIIPPPSAAATQLTAATQLSSTVHIMKQVPLMLEQDSSMKVRSTTKRPSTLNDDVETTINSKPMCIVLGECFWQANYHSFWFIQYLNFPYVFQMVLPTQTSKVPQIGFDNFVVLAASLTHIGRFGRLIDHQLSNVSHVSRKA